MKEKKRFKTKVKATDSSQLTDQTIGEVIESKIEFVVEKTRSEPPYINWLSKYSLVWGGKIFGSLEYDDPLRVGFVSSYDYKNRKYKRSHLPGRMPTESEQERMEKLYGVSLPWPPRGLSDIIQNAFRKIEDRLIENDDIIIIAPCRGYIDRNGLLVDPAWNKTEEWTSNMVSGYLLYRTDSEGLSIVQNYLLNEANSILQRQVERTKATAPRLRESRIIAANSAAIKGDRRLQRIKSLEILQTKEKIEDWNNLLALKASEEEADNEE
jgi:hypothetical protein